jgi:hypothetical protein
MKWRLESHSSLRLQEAKAEIGRMIARQVMGHIFKDLVQVFLMANKRQTFETFADRVTP